MALLVVGIGDCKVSDNPLDILVTHALGSCIAVLLYDPVATVAGLLHFMLPDSNLDSEKACKLPSLFADTGIALLLRRSSQLGAVKARIGITVAGGAQMLDAAGTFNIGQRNYVAMKKVFADAGIGIQQEDIGGTSSRTISIDVANGRIQLRTSGIVSHAPAVAERKTWLR
jgi:chemotaxis protein CheD